MAEQGYELMHKDDVVASLQPDDLSGAIFRVTPSTNPELLPCREEIAELYAEDDSIAFADSILTGYEKKQALLARFMERGILSLLRDI